MKTFFLRPESNRWVLSEFGVSTASTYANKRDALSSGGRRAALEFGALVILHSDGTVEEERRYPPPGTPAPPRR